MYSEIPYFIDPHAHCKTWTTPNHRKKSAMQLLVEEAKEADIGKIFDMPNIENPVTKSPVIRKVDVDARLKFARQQGVSQNYRTYIGATPNQEQLEEAASVVFENNLVPGIKAYMGTSVGALGITKEPEQKIVYATLADCGYDGVIALHCEDDAVFNKDAWKPESPVTHCIARPLESELSSIKKQIEFAREADFIGTLLCCHTTSGKSIELFKDAKNDYGLNVAVEVSPHHTLLRMEDMGPLGAFGKMNPPLRAEDEQKGLMEYAKHETEIPVIAGSDHARHPFFKKIRAPYMSGLGVEVYKLYDEMISQIRSDPSVPHRRVDDITYNNIVNIFGKKKC